MLDKLELVLAKIGSHARMASANTDGSEDPANEVAFDVHSGFRTPAHNDGVWRAAPTAATSTAMPRILQSTRTVTDA